MKKLHIKLIIFFIVGVSISLLSNCSPNESSSKIVGAWEVTNAEYEASVNNIAIQDYLLNEKGYSQEDADEALELLYSYIESLLYGTIEFDAEFWYWTNIGPTGYEEGDWTINKDETIITLDEGTEWETDLTVHSLTNTSLRISFSLEIEEELDQDFEQPTEIITLNVNLTLSKGG